MKTFAKAQLSSLVGGIVDYFTMIFFTEVVGVFFTYSIIIGGLVGAVVNFLVNRRFTFQAHTGKKRIQVPRFLLIVAGSIFLKTYGTYILTTYMWIDYKISRLMVDATVALTFNFPMQKYWVFNHPDGEDR
jgi:putative flippase GtrA